MNYIKYYEDYSMNKFFIKITKENRDELKEFYNRFEDINKIFSWNIYFYYDIYKNRFRFSKNRNTFLKTGAIETTDIKLFKSYVLKNINKTTNNKQEEQEELDYFDRMEQIKKEAEMDNKPFYEINPSY